MGPWGRFVVRAVPVALLRLTPAATASTILTCPAPSCLSSTPVLPSERNNSWSTALYATGTVEARHSTAPANPLTPCASAPKLRHERKRAIPKQRLRHSDQGPRRQTKLCPPARRNHHYHRQRRQRTLELQRPCRQRQPGSDYSHGAYRPAYRARVRTLRPGDVDSQASGPARYRRASNEQSELIAVAKKEREPVNPTTPLRATHRSNRPGQWKKWVSSAKPTQPPARRGPVNA